MAHVRHISMEGNKMSTKEVELTESTPVSDLGEEGPRWSVQGKFQTFSEADTKRTKMLEDETLQVKIHYMGTSKNRFYAVKTRENPEIARREEKKKRKQRMDKKRRKK